MILLQFWVGAPRAHGACSYLLYENIYRLKCERIGRGGGGGVITCVDFYRADSYRVYMRFPTEFCFVQTLMIDDEAHNKHQCEH